MKRKSLTLILGVINLCIYAQIPTQNTDSLITQDAQLDSLYHTLDEVLIVGERPIVRAQPGKLVYDLPKMIKDRPVDNIYDAVKELPGVFEIDGSLQLSGQGVTVVLDGKVTTLSQEQLQALLKSIPANRIENAEVMYNAPARYQVKGALINIILKRANNEHIIQSELFSKYYSQGQNNFTQRGSLIYRHGKLSTDFLYTYNHYSNYHTIVTKEAIHTLDDGSVYEIRDTTNNHAHGNTHAFRLGADYDFSKNHQLSLVYTGQYFTGGGSHLTTGTLYGNTEKHSHSWLHNLRMDYRTPIGLSAGIEMTYYKSPYDQVIRSVVNDESLDFYTENAQRINSWKAFLSGEHPLGKGWGMNYGAIYTTNIDNSYQFYYDADTYEPLISDKLTNMHSQRKERTLNFYAGLTKMFNEKLSLDFSFAAEHYKSTTWDEWDFYPTLNLSYVPSQSHILQVSLKSNKTYPPYWSMQEAISYQSAYSEIHGNPLLVPQKLYSGGFTYMLKSKYVFGVYYSHFKDYTTQTLYQSPERLVEIYKYLNFDYRQQVDIQFFAPFRVKNWLDSRISIVGSWVNEKDSDFWDIPFNRHSFQIMAYMNNTFTLPTKADLKFTLSGMIRSKSKQATYDLPASGYVNVSLHYAFAKQRAILELYCNDLFETSGVNPQIRFKGQNLTNTYSCFRELGVSFTYRFGDYKEKKRNSVDTSRFN